MPQRKDGHYSFFLNGKVYPYGMLYPKAVFHYGRIDYHGRNAFYTDFMINPCIMIKLV